MTTAVDVLHSVDLTPHRLVDSVLTPDVQEFLVDLHRAFQPGRNVLLANHADAAKRFADQARPSFDPQTAYIRSGEWHIAPPPLDLTNRRTELTGPVRREAMVEALNSGANVFMADFEDTTTPNWDNVLSGQANLRDAYAGTLTAIVHGEIRTPGPDAAAIMVRTRGWHLDESNMKIDGESVAASLFDFAVCAFHNSLPAIAAGTGPYFYLPKFESAADARLWSDVLQFTEERLGLHRGTIRVTVLIETIAAAFEMDEILFELRDHITGLHTGNWDYLFSIVKSFRNDSSFVLPDRADLSATTPFIRSFTELLVSVCHRRGAHALGGMSGIVPDPINPDRTAAALRKVTVDKRREAGDGFDGTRIAHPAVVSLAEAEFDRVLSYRPNQIEVQRDDVYVTAGDLLAITTTRGECTEAGLRRNLRIGMHYLGEWLAGTGAVAIDDHIEDLAMAELCRVQVWQWRHHGIELTNGFTVDEALIRRLATSEHQNLRKSLGEAEWSSGRFDEAFSILLDLVLAEDLADFIPHQTAGLH
ncbi:MAG: malate synthase A [Acidimicrobiaceae bacterium]|jgi:malate synthase|nr:malate synthase A [Acidimicrobiaceae bacterium]MBT5579696.1 malate synthase A [Acidimicrobiaceae bacterium]MBT5850087.1 malate synthase A [Acidimicrobiaceae bacterium]